MYGLNASGRAPAALTIEALRASGVTGETMPDRAPPVYLDPIAREPRRVHGRSWCCDALRDLMDRPPPPFSPHTVTVPGAVSGWCALHSRFGKLGLPEVKALH